MLKSIIGERTALISFLLVFLVCSMIVEYGIFSWYRYDGFPTYKNYIEYTVKTVYKY